MAIDPVKIPQNVYIEDRIVGPLTLRQTLIMAVGGGFSYTLYTSLSKAMGGKLDPVTTVLVWIPCLISVAFALIKVNDLSLSRLLLLLIERSNNPNKRVWIPRTGLTIHIRTLTLEMEKAEKEKEEQRKKAAAEAHTQTRLSELTTVLDRPLQGTKTEESVPPQEATATPVAEAAPPVETTKDEHPEETLPRPPVDPRRISADTPPPQGTGPDDGLSAYRGIFRDIHPQE